jgi:hypothetical protein
MTVREATEDDLFEVMVLAKEFCNEAPEMFVWDRAKVESLLRQAIQEPNYVLLVAENTSGEIVGGLLGACTEMFMSKVKLAAELGWFMSKESRGTRQAVSLVKSFEEWGKTSGADYIVMADIRGISDLSNLYGKMGYVLSEVSYTKRVV